MIPFFPRIYEGELFYSILARYHRYSGNVEAIKTIRDLYGMDNVRVYSHVVRKLNILYERIKIFNIPSIEELIAKHTFYFYYTNFKGIKTKDSLKEVMLNGEENEMNRVVGIKHNVYFKYCPHCTREDIENYGETYWRLQHQIFGVQVCLKHNETLCDSDVSWSNRGRKKGFREIEAATLENCPISRKGIVFSDETKYKLVMIAEELKKMASSDYNINPDTISDIYRYVLFRKGYMKGKVVNIKKLYRDFTNYYGQSLLELLNLTFNSNKRSNWVISILKRGRQTFSPVQHALIIIFLGEKIDTINQYNDQEYSSFGKGPYPCLNPFARHYLNSTIDTVNLSMDQRGNCIGIFECKCGFKFSCLLKEYNNQKQFIVHQIIDIEQRWVDYFELLANGNLKQEDLFCLDESVITLMQKRYLIYIQNKKRKLSGKPSAEKVEKYRREWLRYRERYPDFTVNKIRSFAGGVYTFLYRYDRDWLYENTIYIERSIAKRNNWAEIDKNLLIEVQEVINKIKNYNGYPIKVTKHSIRRELSRDIGAYTLKNCPLTAEFLKLNVESVEQFQIRRIYWAVEKLINNNEDVVKYKIRKIARLSDNISDEANNELSKIISNK
ncbi:TnsD family Tn7-like transposition protein [Bacillus cereus]|uniref:TnsD family Tn7-like transposition protein n=1 Tax=Bacillus cereus group TaxID=86661 RepID=UPI000A301A5E|nr:MULTISPECIES: TnsD family Tn7-like transposition protein [Bacillus cereus group]SME71437.1 hypothetical protein BACERE00198_03117 [Bacillus cereus]